MEKNLLLAIGLSMLVVFLWMSLIGNRQKKRETLSGQKDSNITEMAGDRIESKEKRVSSETVSKEKELGPAEIKTIYQDKTDIYEFEILSDGGFSRFKLNNEKIDFFIKGENNFFGISGHKFILKEATSKDRAKVISLVSENKKVKLTYKFYNDYKYFDYTIDNAEENLSISLGEGLSSDTEKEAENITNQRFSYMLDKSIKRENKARELNISPQYMALENKYYVAGIFSADSSTNLSADIRLEKKGNGYLHPVLRYSQKVNTYRVYIGEKRYLDLMKFKPGFEKIIDFGYFREIGKLIFYALNYLYSLTKNYGFSIIILTIFVQILMSPLTIKNFKSMKAMRDLQPLMNDLRVKYKNEPTKLNTEIMSLYKTKKVNPFGGCLPMILQIPIFWALFTTLRNLVELKNARFIFWINDLSLPDTPLKTLPIFHLLPLIMGLTMILQQKMTPASGDETQAKMMAIMMPVVFTFMFWGFPSGLVLYWFTSNLLSILTQYLYEKKLSAD